MIHCNSCITPHIYPETFQYCNIANVKRIKPLYQPLLSYIKDAKYYLKNNILKECNYCDSHYHNNIEPYLFPIIDIPGNKKSVKGSLYLKSLRHIECLLCCGPSYKERKRENIKGCLCNLCKLISYDYNPTNCDSCGIEFNDLRKERICVMCCYLNGNKFPLEKRIQLINNNSSKCFFLENKRANINISVEIDNILLNNNNLFKKEISEMFAQLSSRIIGEEKRFFNKRKIKTKNNNHNKRKKDFFSSDYYHNNSLNSYSSPSQRFRSPPRSPPRSPLRSPLRSPPRSPLRSPLRSHRSSPHSHRSSPRSHRSPPRSHRLPPRSHRSPPLLPSQLSPPHSPLLSSSHRSLSRSLSPSFQKKNKKDTSFN